YYHPGKVYGNSHCFTPKYNKHIDYEKILEHMRQKHVILATCNIDRFTGFAFGKSTDYIAAPASNAWAEYDRIYKEVLQKATQYPKEDVLVMASLGSAAKVLSYDLTEIGYTVWDSGQFFDYALDKFGNK
ncbi:MAG TPA: GT-D fold domain-containing glycosyltransferase, partial [Candidatus Paceibacterota bacterium]|nr:GT-D fold domain-containing glycosyltransferase [Candidatus Paceibacterota bacterium]